MISKSPYAILSAVGHLSEPADLYERLPNNRRERVQSGSEKVDRALK